MDPLPHIPQGDRPRPAGAFPPALLAFVQTINLWVECHQHAPAGTARQLLAGALSAVVGAFTESLVRNDLAPLASLLRAQADWIVNRPSMRKPGKTVGQAFAEEEAKRKGTNN